MSSSTTKKPPDSSPVTKQEVQKRDLNAAERVEMALKLRAQKVGYKDIARLCGYAGGPGSAYNAIQRELQRTVTQDVDRLRREELHSLELLEFEVWKRLADKKYEKTMLFAVDRIVAIKERRAKLMGLDKGDGNFIANQVIVRDAPPGYFGPAAVDAPTQSTLPSELSNVPEGTMPP